MKSHEIILLKFGSHFEFHQHFQNIFELRTHRKSAGADRPRQTYLFFPRGGDVHFLYGRKILDEFEMEQQTDLVEYETIQLEARNFECRENHNAYRFEVLWVVHVSNDGISIASSTRLVWW